MQRREVAFQSPGGIGLEDRRDIILEAIKDLHKNETFERALGRVLRKRGREYQEYQSLMAEIRRRAEKDHVDLLVAAKLEASVD